MPLEGQPGEMGAPCVGGTLGTLGRWERAVRVDLAFEPVEKRAASLSGRGVAVLDVRPTGMSGELAAQRCLGGGHAAVRLAATHTIWSLPESPGRRRRES